MTRPRALSVSTPGSTPSAGERLWTVSDVAHYLGVPVQTLYQWRYLGTGPAAYRVGKHLRYDPAAVPAWLDGQAA